jgi:hypothetical protein
MELEERLQHMEEQNGDWQVVCKLACEQLDLFQQVEAFTGG